MGKRLTNLQWRLTRFAIGVSLGLTVVLLVLFLLYFKVDARALFSAQWLGLPFLLLILLVAFVIGALCGLYYGSRIKQRLEVLLESILRFEHGNYAHRVPELGEDEIGLVAMRLNQMAERIEKQVASLQKLSTEKAEWNEQLKKMVITEERQRLARELHDAVSQQLFAISMMTSAVLEGMGDEDSPLRQQISLVEQMAGKAQNEMRALLLHLRPVSLEGKGLKEGLEELLEEFCAKQPIEMRWEIGELPPLPKGIEDHLFRIAQEALSNIFRHSQATAVSIHLHAHNRQLHLRIMDNGVGFDMNQSKPSSYGLQSIQERAHEIGGVAEVVSFVGKGTQVHVQVPLVDEERSETIDPRATR